MGVTVDASSALARIDRLTKAVGRDGLRQLEGTAAREMQRGIAQGFRSGINPQHRGQATSRRQSASWPPLRHSGGLRRASHASAQAYKSKLLIRATVEDSRSGNRSYHAVAGAILFGRRDQRKKMIGRGSSKGKGGPMPPRHFAGIGTAGKRAIEAKLLAIIRR